MHFPDGMIYYDKIAKAGCRKPRKYLVDLMKKTPKSEEHAVIMQQTCLLFKKYILPNRINNTDFVQPPLFTPQENDDWNGKVHGESNEASDSEEEKEDVHDDDDDFFANDARRISKETVADNGGSPTINLEHDWRNGVLVLVSTRLGLKKVGTEYFGPVKSFFMQQLNCGIIGGRPKEAYYLVGMQEDSFIFLDPHNTLPTVPFDLEEIKKNHISYHENTAKKIHYTKIDPTMTFCFYVRNHVEFKKLKGFLDR